MQNLMVVQSDSFATLAIVDVRREFVQFVLGQRPTEAFGFSSEGGGSPESYLGVDTRDITPDRLAALPLKEEKGVEVTMVDQDAPAGKAGLKEHDVILSVNGTAIESVEQLRRVIHEIPAGRLISIGVSRGGQRHPESATYFRAREALPWLGRREIISP